MGARNRGTYSYSNRKGNSLIIVRNLFIFGALALLSFGFGFMVIARMLPMGPKSDGTSGTSQNSSTDGSRDRDAGAASTPVQGGASTHVSPSIVTHIPLPTAQKPVQAPGPSIDPTVADGKTQKPAAIDGNPGPDANQADPNATAESNPDRTNDSASKPPADGAALTPLPHRRHHHANESVQPAANPDDSSAAAAGAGGDQNTNVGPAKAAETAGGLYRVQFGVYSTREAADAVARQAGDKSLDASVQPYTQDGRTLYRVTHGLYRHKSNADAARMIQRRDRVQPQKIMV